MKIKFLLAFIFAGVISFSGVAQTHQTDSHHYHNREVSQASGIVCTTYEEVLSILEAWKTGGYGAAKRKSIELIETTIKQPCAPFFRKTVFILEVLKRERLIDINEEPFAGVIISMRNGASPFPVYAIVSESLPGQST